MPTGKRKTRLKTKPHRGSNSPTHPSVKAHFNLFEPRLNRHNLVEIPFYDRLGRVCLAGEGFPTTQPTLMLGAASAAQKIGQLSRMDLDQEQVARLLPFLEHFVRTGKLPVAPADPIAT